MILHRMATEEVLTIAANIKCYSQMAFLCEFYRPHCSYINCTFALISSLVSGPGQDSGTYKPT